jgi:hypothetical protein
MKNVQEPGEARQNNKFPMRIRIQPTNINADPDPQHWLILQK